MIDFNQINKKIIINKIFHLNKKYQKNSKMKIKKDKENL